MNSFAPTALPVQTPPVVYNSNPTIEVVVKQPSAPTGKEIGSFQQRNVQTQNQDKRSYLSKLCSDAFKSVKALAEYTIDLANYAETVIVRAAQGFAYGAAAGVVAGIALTAMSPYLAGGAFAVSIAACTTGGTIIGAIQGHREGSEAFKLARATRIAVAEAQTHLS